MWFVASILRDDVDGNESVIMSEKKEIFFHAYPRSVLDLINLYKDGNLNLSPGFQRKSVWNNKDREKLIDSIIRNYPIPAIFLYKRTKDGKLIYDVIDGKQRLESILMFTGKMRGGKFSAKVQLPNNEELEKIDWNFIKLIYAISAKRKRYLVYVGKSGCVLQCGEFRKQTLHGRIRKSGRFVRMCFREGALKIVMKVSKNYFRFNSLC